jgi:hypothetical protein
MVKLSGESAKELIRLTICLIGVTGTLALNVSTQYPGGGGPTGGGPATVYNFNSNYHVGFDSPEAWGLKYFASGSLLSGLQPPAPGEDHRIGSISVGFEVGWLPQLDAGQRQIGFKGTVPEDLNKAPIFARPVVRVGLPGKFSVVAAAPPPFRMFGVRRICLRSEWNGRYWNGRTGR